MNSILIIALIGSTLVYLVQAAVRVNKAPKYSLDNLDQHFENFKQKHGKTYQSQQHRYKRF